MRPFLLAGALAVLIASPAAAAPRVVSLDQCADQYVLALSPRSAIAGLSKRADDADSYLGVQARGLPQQRATLEAVLAARPQIVVRYWGGGPAMVRALEHRGVRVVAIDEADTFDQVRADVRKVAAALDAGPAGEALVAGMDRKLAASRGAWGGRRALYLTSGGFTAGKGTLVDAILDAAGLGNAARRSGFQPAPLESLALDPPSAVVRGFFDAALDAFQRWSPGRSQVLRRVVRDRTLVSLPGSELGCPAWFAADAAAQIAAARR